MSDTYFDPSSAPLYGGSFGGALSPLVTAAAARDPRRLLVQSLIQQGQATQNTPTYNGKAALAKALTIGLGGAANAALDADYANQNRQVQDTLQKAAQAGEGWTNPDTGQVMPGTQNPSAMVQALMANPLTAPQAMSMIQMQQQMQAKAKLDLMNKLAEQHLTFDGQGNIVPMAGAPAAVSQLAAAQSGGTATGTNAANAQPGIGGQAAVISATTPAEAAKAAAVETAKTPALVQRAVSTAAGTEPIEVKKAVDTAAGTMPIEVFKEQFKPIVDIRTGEAMIPGLDTATSAKVMAAIGIDPKAVAKSLQQTPAQTAPGGQGTPVAAPGQQTTAPAQPPSGAAPIPSSKPPMPVPYGTKSPDEEVPKHDLPTGLLPSGPGTIIPGRDPVKIKAGEQAVDQAGEQFKGIDEAGHNAAGMHASLGTMRTEVQNGGVTPSATAPARYMIAGYLNATLGPQVAKSVTGLDPAAADVVNKEATRMGLSYARQTEGAREAVAGINIALKANPQLGQTKEGFMKILDLIDAGAQHDIAAQQYGNAWFKKNGHYVGLQGWLSQNHPPAEFTSKVLPYNLPMLQSGQVNADQLQPNVTYNITSQGHTGPAIWTGEGFKPVAQ